jgi:hypothetical protein
MPYAPVVPNVFDLLNSQPGSMVRLQDANSQAQLQQMQMFAQSQLAAQMQSPNIALQQQNALANIYSAAPPRNGWYHRERAIEARDKGERIIARIAFWRGIAGTYPLRPLARVAMRRLVAELEKQCDSAERWIGMGLDDLKEPEEQRAA